LAQEAFIIAGDTQTETGTEELSAKRSARTLNWLWLVLALAIIVAACLFIRMPKTPLEHAIELIKANRAAAALPILEDIAQKQTEGNVYLPWLAQCYLSTDRIAEGRTALDTAIKVKAPCETVRPVVQNFSKYYRQKNDFEEAERLLASAQTLCPATDFIDERKAIYSDWVESDIRKNQVKQALDHMEMLSTLEGSMSTKQAHMLVDLYRQQAAIEETQNGDDSKAIVLLEKSLPVCDEPATRMALGNLYSKNNDFSHAIVHFRQVYQSDPNNLEARHKLIDMSMKIGDFQGAQEAASELADREKSVENFELLAEIALKLKNYAGAVRSLEEATTLTQKDYEVLEKLEQALNDWAADLARLGKQDESLTVKGRAERVAEQIKAIQKEMNPDLAEKETTASAQFTPGSPPIALAASRIWLSKGSFTPEGEIKLKSISDEALEELALTVVFFDNTSKKRTGSVTVSAAGAGHPILPGQTRSLYFSSPNIVKTDHQLSVIIFWKGKLIRELPVIKER
jgi:tetratricopeptide (TPR) repeat protein